MGKENKKVGFTIGKFAPLHKGHQFLIETAFNQKRRKKKSRVNKKIISKCRN